METRANALIVYVYLSKVTVVKVEKSLIMQLELLLSDKLVITKIHNLLITKANFVVNEYAHLQT